MHVFLGVLSYKGEPEIRVAHALARTARELAVAGLEFEIHSRTSDGILPRARNSLIASFKKSEATDLVMIDDDVAWQEGELVRLLLHPVDCVGGTYRFKRDDEGYPLNWHRAQANLIATATGLLKVDDLPGGFLRLTRKCIDDMIAGYPTRKYYDKVADGDAWALFDFEHVFDHECPPGERGGYRGEDYVFCKRYRAIGGTVYLDPELRLDHIGKKVFSGCIGDFLGGKRLISREDATHMDNGAAAPAATVAGVIGNGAIPDDVRRDLLAHPAWAAALGE